MINTSERRKRIALRLVTYAIMTIATIVGAVFCIAWAMGYRFNLQSGRLSQVALLQLNSYPTGATVDINGTRLIARTQTRSNISVGKTTVTMNLKGYRSWSKTVEALPSSVRWLDYIRLVPQNVSTEAIHTFPSVSQMIVSPSREWLAIQTATNSHSINLVDVSDPKNAEYDDLTIDDNLLTSPDGGYDEKLTLVEWDEGSRYVLLRHDYGDERFEYLVLDRQDIKDARNITRDFGLNVDNVHFSGKSGDVLYAIADGGLRKLDYGSKAVSAPIATDVVDYQLYGDDRIIATIQTKGKDSVKQIVSIYDNNKKYRIKSYDDDQAAIARYAEYGGKKYAAIARGETVSIYTDPISESPDKDEAKTAYLSSPGGIDWMNFSPSGRFVMAGKGNRIVCYDVETYENYSFELSHSGEPEWLDDYHLLDTKDDMVVMLEFDGANSESIVSGRTPAALSVDQKYLFSLDDIAGGVVLQRSSMTIN